MKNILAICVCVMCVSFTEDVMGGRRKCAPMKSWEKIWVDRNVVYELDACGALKNKFPHKKKRDLLLAFFELRKKCYDKIGAGLNFRPVGQINLPFNPRPILGQNTASYRQNPQAIFNPNMNLSRQNPLPVLGQNTVSSQQNPQAIFNPNMNLSQQNPLPISGQDTDLSQQNSQVIFDPNVNLSQQNPLPIFDLSADLSLQNSAITDENNDLFPFNYCDFVFDFSSDF